MHRAWVVRAGHRGTHGIATQHTLHRLLSRSRRSSGSSLALLPALLAGYTSTADTKKKILPFSLL